MTGSGSILFKGVFLLWFSHFLSFSPALSASLSIPLSIYLSLSLCLSLLPPLSGHVLWLVPAVSVLGRGAVQPGVLSDPTGPPGHAACCPCVPAAVEGRNARRQGGQPHVLCPGLQLVGPWRGR